MAETIIVLTEDALSAFDVANILDVHPEPGLTVEVLVPADTEHHVIAELVDHLGLLDLRAAWDAVVGKHPSADEARGEAHAALAASLAHLSERGVLATGAVVDDDPIPSLAEVIDRTGASELIVVSEPQMLEDTFHRTWAHRARETFGIPVLHFYTGTDIVGT